MELTGLDAALGLAEVQSRLGGTGNGRRGPGGLLRPVPELRSDRQGLAHLAARPVVTNVDDHDQIRQGPTKSR